MVKTENTTTKQDFTTNKDLNQLDIVFSTETNKTVTFRNMKNRILIF